MPPYHVQLKLDSFEISSVIEYIHALIYCHDVSTSPRNDFLGINSAMNSHSINEKKFSTWPEHTGDIFSYRDLPTKPKNGFQWVNGAMNDHFINEKQSSTWPERDSLIEITPLCLKLLSLFILRLWHS